MIIRLNGDQETGSKFKWFVVREVNKTLTVKIDPLAKHGRCMQSLATVGINWDALELSAGKDASLGRIGVCFSPT